MYIYVQALTVLCLIQLQPYLGIMMFLLLLTNQQPFFSAHGSWGVGAGHFPDSCSLLPVWGSEEPKARALGRLGTETICSFLAQHVGAWARMMIDYITVNRAPAHGFSMWLNFLATWPPSWRALDLLSGGSWLQEIVFQWTVKAP